MGMGPLGAAARPLMAEAGSLLNYGFLGTTPTAPNQWPAGLLKATLAI
jgi:3-dehydroquinate dehydratase